MRENCAWSGSTCLQLALTCPPNADLYCNGTSQIWVGHNCPGSRPPLLLLLPQPRGQPDLHSKFSLVSPMVRQGRGWGRRGPHSRHLRATPHSIPSRECSSNWEGAGKLISLGFIQLFPSSHCFWNALLHFFKVGRWQDTGGVKQLQKTR